MEQVGQLPLRVGAHLRSLSREETAMAYRTRNTSYPGGSGTVRGQVDHDGHVAIQLSFGQNSAVDLSGYGTLVSDQITGTFSSLYSGEFTAARTEPN